ncbi:MAG TPA: hypothetical protein VGI43_07285 [Mucilaginibacter sp.]|jgi:hypothetical protein
MKPDEEQMQYLKDYLRAVLKYHETYEEVYDHILLALEERPQEKFFASTVDAIIMDDFGGNNGLMMMEENCRNAIAGEVWKQYWRCFFSYLKFPYVIYTVFISMILGYIAIHVRYKVIFLSEIIWVLSAIMIPVLLFAGRKFKIGYKLDGPQKLLKDGILGKLVSKPFQFIIWYFLLSVLIRDTQGIFNYHLIFDLWRYISPLILIAVFVAATIHCLSFIRLIKGEFKISIMG